MLAFLAEIIISATLILISYYIFIRNNGDKSESETSLESDSTRIAKTMKLKCDCLILFATQSGTSEEFSRILSSDLARHGIKSKIVNLSNYKMIDLHLVHEETVWIFLVSTYGNGEPPENARDFFKNKTWFSNLKGFPYAIFGLGDTSYPDFNGCARLLDSLLAKIESKSMMNTFYGDNKYGIEDHFILWKQDLIERLLKFKNIQGKEIEPFKYQYYFAFTWNYRSSIRLDEDTENFVNPGPFDPKISDFYHQLDENIIFGKLVSKEKLNKAGERSYVKCSIKIESGKIAFSPGDHVEIFPENNLDQVLRLVQLLGISHKLGTAFSFSLDDDLINNKHNKMIVGTYAQILSKYLDLSRPVNKHVLSIVKEMLSDKGSKEALTLLIQGKCADNQLSMLEVFEKFAAQKMTLGMVLEVSPKLSPRRYSICSSNNSTPHIIDITFDVKRRTGELNTRDGVATTWLESLAIGSLIPLNVKPTDFRLPASLETPIIMIGPGTGISPFIGFLKEREFCLEKRLSIGPALLFYGCRKRAEDFLYEELLEAFLRNGALSSLNIAFSRDNDGIKKTYVQDLMRQCSEELFNHLNNGAYIFVCGDAKNMAKDVMAVWTDILMTYKGWDENRAMDYILEMKRSKRYVEDVWSS